MNISFYLRRGMAWAPVWIPVLALHLWAVWVIWTTEPTVPGVINSGDDPLLLAAWCLLVPIIFGIGVAIIHVLVKICRWAWHWSRERDGQVVAQAVAKSYLGPGK